MPGAFAQLLRDPADDQRRQRGDGEQQRLGSGAAATGEKSQTDLIWLLPPAVRLFLPAHAPGSRLTERCLDDCAAGVAVGAVGGLWRPTAARDRPRAAW